MTKCDEIQDLNKQNRNIPKWNEWENSEKPALCLLVELGYTYIKPADLRESSSTYERSSLREVLLKKRLTAKIKEFNPWINEYNIKQVFRMLTIPQVSQIEFNQEIWDYLTKPHTFTVEQDIEDGRGRRHQPVKLIDWDNIEKNEFIVSNQYKVNSSKGNIIPDIVVFVNGIPLVVIECKSPILRGEHIIPGIRQLHMYQERAPKLFCYNQILIATAGLTSYYGVVGNNYSHFKQWKEPYPITESDLEGYIKKTGRTTTKPTPQDILIYGLLEPHNLLDLIRNFMVYQTVNGKLIKMMARYQQFRATNKTIQRILDPKERGGTIWHTQGSGKSLTMLFSSVKMRREPKLENPLLVFITDRIDLVDQLNQTFIASGFPNPQEAEDAEHLQELIRTGQGQTIFTTIQKFKITNKETEEEAEKGDKEGYPVLNESENIIVLVDEAHRSQYKTFAMRMRKSMPNAFFIAYTGTPLARTEKDEKITVGKGKTVSKFGSFIDVYDIRQSVEDGVTVQILYENRLPELTIEDSTIDELFDRVFADKTEEEREAIKDKYATKANLLGAEERIKKVCLDILDHYETKIKPNGFKAQIVVNSRELAVKYKMFLDRFNAPESVVIISPNRLYDDDLKKLGVPFITNKTDQKKYIKRFKAPNDSLTFLIVCDMLITGFDAPVEQVMYLDKSLKEHNLLQAIARVNRTYEHKTRGLIVDYYGISLNLEEALEIFDTNDVEGVMKPIDSEIPRLEQFHRTVMQHLNGLDSTDLEGLVLAFHEEEKRTRLREEFRNFAQTLDIILPDPRAEPYLGDLKLLERLIAALNARYRPESGLDIAECGGKIKQLIDEYIRSPSITQLVDPVPILSPKFQEKLEIFKRPESQASEIEHAIRHEINVKIDEDPEFYTSLKERLEKIIEMYRQERIDLAEKIKELKALVTDVKARPDIARAMGLNSAEMAFYNICKREMEQVGITDDRELVKVTYKILEKIEPLINIVDWTRKYETQRKIRKKIKDELRVKNPDYTREELNQVAVELVNLAKVHYKY